MKSLYLSKELKKEILFIYQNKLNELNIDYEYKELETHYGTTNLIVTGSSNNPPLVLIHGSNGCAPIALDVFPNLRNHFQVFAIDVIAQPNKSSEQRPSMDGNGYGLWINEIIRGLNLYNVFLVGFSFGGLIIWKGLLYDESRIKASYLIAPAGIVNGNSIKALWYMFLPMKLYKWTKNVYYLHTFIDSLFTKKDDFALRFLSKVLLNFKMDFTPIPTITEKEAKQIKTPITIFAAENDLIFPGVQLLKKAKLIFPSLSNSVLLKKSKHVQDDATNRRIEEIIINNGTSGLN